MTMELVEILIPAAALLLSACGIILFRFAAEAEGGRKKGRGSGVKASGTNAEAAETDITSETDAEDTETGRPSETDTEEVGSSEEETEENGSIENLPLALIAAMFISNLAVSIFLRRFYGRHPDDVILTVLCLTLLWPLAWCDFKKRLIPNRILIAGLLLRCIVLAGEIVLIPGEVKLILISSLIACGAMLIASGLCRAMARGAVGMGDIKLLGVMGLILGADKIWEAVFCALIFLFVVSVVLLITKRANKKTEIPFAPFALFGTLFAAFFMGI